MTVRAIQLVMHDGEVRAPIAVAPASHDAMVGAALRCMVEEAKGGFRYRLALLMADGSKVVAKPARGNA